MSTHYARIIDGNEVSMTACGRSVHHVERTHRLFEVDCGLCRRTTEYKNATVGIPTVAQRVVHFSPNAMRAACGLHLRTSSPNVSHTTDPDLATCVACKGTICYHQAKEAQKEEPMTATVKAPPLTQQWAGWLTPPAQDEPDEPEVPEALPMGKDHDAPFRSDLQDGPHYAHDCSECVFLGTKDRMDLYWCPQSGDHSTVIARHGDRGEDYVSGLWNASENKYLAVAVVRAFQSGHLSDEDMALL